MNRAQRRKAERLERWEAEKAKQKLMTGLYEKADQIQYDDVFVMPKKGQFDFIKKVEEKAAAQQKWINEEGLSVGQFETSKGSEKTRSGYIAGDKYEIVKAYYQMVDAGVIKPTVHFDRYEDIIDWMEEEMDIEVMSKLIDAGEKKQSELDERARLADASKDWVR